ncbi:DUF1573 domain-containing protein [Mariniblastus fucicola]|nr:DUF1573 domain-containing protein [Mariniblastus fucicola]
MTKIAFEILICSAFFLMPATLVDSISDESFDVTASAAITQIENALYYFADFDLGTLSSGEKGTVVLKLTNPTSEPFVFTEVVKSCNCVDVHYDMNEIGAGETVDFEFTLETPKFSNSAVAAGSLTLVNKDVAESERRPLNLRFRYKLAGLLNIEREMCYLEIPPTQQVDVLRIPVLVTEPTTPSSLELVADETLEVLDFRFEVTPDNLHIVAGVPEEIVKDGAVNGTLKIVDTTSKREDSIFITLRKGTAFKISPKVIRFRKENAASSNLRSATVLLRIPEGEDPDEYQASAKILGRHCDVKSTKLAERVIKLDLSFDFSTALKENDDFVEWRIVRGNDVSETVSRFVFVQ